MLISSDMVEKALAVLDDHATLERYAREARLRESLLKSVEAVQMKKFSELGVSAQTREARASTAYQDALNLDAEAYAKLVAHRGKIAHAGHVIELYRTQSATARSHIKIG